VWETTLPGEYLDEFFMSSVALADGVAVVFCGSLFGVEAATGKILWEGDAQKTKGSHTSPVVWQSAGGEWIVANISGGETACFEPRSGKEMWRVKSEANNSTPVVLGDRLITYGSSRRSGLRCFTMSPSGADEVWAYRGAADKGSSPVVVGDNVYVQGEKRLACVNLKTGDEQWNTTLDLASPQYTSLVAVDGKVMYAYDGLLCFAADPTEFRPLMDAKFDKTGLMAPESVHREKLKLAEVEAKENGLEESMKIFKREVSDQGPLACTSPALADGRLYLRLRDKLACYDLRTTATAGTAAAATR
jgi:outer membrane protein assembly factor BamB